jgi:hypothetical protein
MSSRLNGIAGTPQEQVSRHRLAQLAGLLYLSTAPTVGFGVFSAQPLLENSSSHAAAQIAASRPFLELGVLAGSVGAVTWLILAVVFYQLFRPVSERACKLLVVFMVSGALLMLAAFARRMDAIWLVGQSQALGIGGDQLRVQVALAVRSSDNLMQAQWIFSAIWLLPVGYLVYRSGFIPRALGLMLMLGAPWYLAIFIDAVFQVDHTKTWLGPVIGFGSGAPEILAELGTGLWLVIWGTRSSWGSGTVQLAR